MKLIVTLSPEQAQYFHELKYGLMDMDANNSDVINHALMELLLFEEFTGNQVTNFLIDDHEQKYHEAIQSRDFGRKFKPQNEQQKFESALKQAVKPSAANITKDEMIDKHFRKFSEPGLRIASIGTYVQTGEINGSFLITLRELMEEYALQMLKFYKDQRKDNGN